MNGEKKIAGIVDKIIDENGRRIAIGTAVKNWLRDGSGETFRVDVTDRPDIKKGSDIDLSYWK
jgi:hypothetical protein